MTPSSFVPHCRHRLRAVLLSVSLLGGLGAARAEDSPAADPSRAFYLHAATCVAALEADQIALGNRTRDGAAGLRPAMEDVTRLGFTFVGVAYKKGLRNPEADGLLKAARAEQKSWPAAQHARTAAECRVEAETLFNEATTVEQWLVRNRANKRVDKFFTGLAKPGAPGSSAASAPLAAAPASAS